VIAAVSGEPTPAGPDVGLTWGRASEQARGVPQQLMAQQFMGIT